MASYGTAPNNESSEQQFPPRPSNGLNIQRLNEPEFPVARSVDHLLISNRSLSNLNRSDSSGAIRRPYVFNHRSRATSTNSVNSDANSTTNAVDTNRHHNMAIRYRLFNRLDPGGQTLIMPDHVFLPAELFSILPFDDFKDQDGTFNTRHTYIQINLFRQTIIIGHNFFTMISLF
jgi:hypothetical protein